MNGLQKEFGLVKKPWISTVTKGALITVGFGLYVFVESGTRDRLSRMEDKIDRVETKVERLDVRMDRVEIRMDRVDARMDGVETKVDRLEDKIDRLEDKIDRVETKVDEVRGYLKYNVAVPDEAPPAVLIK